jgi:hypothetical protein
MRPLLWLPMAALKAVTILCGLVAVPLMLLTDNRPAWLWRPWANPSDGIHGPDWWSRYLELRGNWLAKRFPSFWWSAVRNPANGLRTYRFVTVKIDPNRVESRGNYLPTNPGPLRRAGGRVGWFYAWHGLYSGFWLCVAWTDAKHMKLRLGWKILPEDKDEVEEWRADGAGFAMAFLPWRDG